MYESMNDIMQSLYSNVATIKTPLGGGQHGNLGLIIKEALYAMLSETPFIVLQDPGPLLVFNLYQTYTAAVKDMVIQEHKEMKRIYENCHNVDSACKGLILDAVEEVYLKEKRNKVMGYLSFTTKEMLKHLLKWYGKISPRDLENNKTKLQEPIDPDLPIKVYFKCVDNCLQYAADAETPCPQKKILQTVYYVISATGLYTEARKTWHKQNKNTKIWASFKFFCILIP